VDDPGRQVHIFPTQADARCAPATYLLAKPFPAPTWASRMVRRWADPAFPARSD